MFDPVMFGQNIYLLIGLLILAGLVALLLISAWTGINVGVWHVRRKNAAQRERGRKFLPDGRACPPSGRGICTRCSRACEKVYHLPAGPRLCPTCFQLYELQVVTEGKRS